MKCGLAMSGGGFHGNFHLGVLGVLAGQQRDGLEYPYDVVRGVSAGALITAQICAAPKADFAAAVDRTKDLWTPIQTRDVHRRHRPFGSVEGLWKPSLRDSRPLQKLVQRMVDIEALLESEYDWAVGATNLDTGEYELLGDELGKLISTAFLASSSFPLFFQPIFVPGRGTFTDGGIHSVTPLKSLIDAGCDEIDVLIASPKQLQAEMEQPGSVIDVGKRALDIMLNALTWKDLALAQAYNEWALADPKCPKRHVLIRVFAPPSELPGNSLEFDPKLAVEIQHVGESVALEVC